MQYLTAYVRNIIFKYGRSKNPKLRQYYLERKFLFNDILTEHFNQSQEIECPNWQKYPFNQLSLLERFNMICPNCIQNDTVVKCSLRVTNKSILNIIGGYVNNSLNPDNEIAFDILNFLGNNNGKEYKAGEIADELDCSYQLIWRRAQKLITREFVERKEINSRSYYSITEYGYNEILKRRRE